VNDAVATVARLDIDFDLIQKHNGSRVLNRVSFSFPPAGEKKETREVDEEGENWGEAGSDGVDADPLPVLAHPFEFYNAWNFCKQGIVSSDADVEARMKAGATLPD
jgi:hypothetical protein